MTGFTEEITKNGDSSWKNSLIRPNLPTYDSNDSLIKLISLLIVFVGKKLGITAVNKVGIINLLNIFPVTPL